MTSNMTAANAQNVSTHSNEPAITPELGAEHGLSPDEYALMLDIVGRTPSFTELGIFSVMWSEHCSYKSSRVWLAKLPTTGEQVIQGPGENAGIVDIGDNQAAVFKMESHNHPSFIEPYQGAATGVGGIMRDVFTMGARPIANLNALRFGAPDHPKTRHLVSGVVAGIAGYGNCMGVPTVGGETNFHASYNGNILVNAMTVGLVDQDRIFYSRGATPGNPVVYVGSKTGRDGIHGATMASAEFDDEAEAQRPTVQVGDPFTEKLLLEACLELMQKDAIICIQDMGAAGLTSSTVEIADKGGIGVELNLDKVPQREQGMTPYEIMLSESQERMLMVLKPGHEDEAREIFEKWELDFAVIGTTTDTGHLVLTMHGRTWCDIPVPPLVDKAPKYNRPTAPTPAQKPVTVDAAPLDDAEAALMTLIACPDIASKRWIWEQYDSLVGGDTLIGPGMSRSAGDAALVRVREQEHKALAVTSDCTPRYCEADPVMGGKQVIAESWRNITAVGATPLAVTDNMNFGNPERPEIMGQFAGCIEGMAAACTALDYPVVSGNVSLYNETNGQAILPTPTIGGVGLLKDVEKRMSMDLKKAGETILLVGQTGSHGHIGQSLYLREVHGREDGPPPEVDLEAERRNGDFIRGLIHDGQITACHDISDGGLLVALAEMAMAVPLDARETGATITLPEGADHAGFLFGEDQGRYVITTTDADAVIERAGEMGVPVMQIGKTGGASIRIDGLADIAVEKLRQANENWLPGFMGAND